MRAFFCGHQTSSWHGTTVQAIQPLPSLSLPEGLQNEARLTDSHACGSPLDPPGGICLTDSHAGGSPMDPPGGIHPTDSLAGGSPLEPPGGIRPTDSLAGGSPMDPPGGIRLTDSLAGGSPLDPPGGIRLTDSLAGGSPLDPPGGIRLTDSLAGGSPLDPPGGIRLTDSLASGSPLDQPGVSQKRKDRSSPLPSPQKLTRSPLPKIQKRHRTGTEGQQEMGKLPPAPKPHLQATQQRTCYSSSLVLSHFRTSGAEKEAQGDILREINTYLLHRFAVYSSTLQQPFLSMQDHFTLTRITHNEKSNVAYLEVMDAVADCRDTIMQLVHSSRERSLLWVKG